MDTGQLQQTTWHCTEAISECIQKNSGTSLRNSGLALAACDNAVGEDQTFSLTVEAALLKLYAPVTTFEKQSAHTSQTLQTSLPVALRPHPQAVEQEWC